MKFQQPQAYISQYPYSVQGEFQGPGLDGFPYPGVGGGSLQPYGGGFPAAPTTTLLPASPAGGAGSGSGSGSSFNLNQIKALVDRMGGIEGIMGTMTKVQKIVGTIQQMQPMLKLLLGSFGSKAAAQSAASAEDVVRRRRRKRRVGSTRRPGGRRGPGRNGGRRR